MSLQVRDRQSSASPCQGKCKETKVAHDVGKIGAVPTAVGGIARAAYARASRLLRDVPELVKRAGLTVKQLDDPQCRIAVRSQIQFLNLIADRLADELLGFHLAADIDLRELGLLYYVQASSNSLGQALRRAQRYCSVQNEGVVMKFTEGSPVRIAFHYNAVRRLDDRHQIEFFITTIVRLCRELSARQLRPIRVKLSHHRTERSNDMSAYCGCEFIFGGESDEIEYPSATGQLPIASADSYLNKLLTKYCEEALLNRRLRAKSWRLAVENALVPLLPHGQCQLSHVSAHLGVTARTLERRLAEEKVSFQDVLDDLRLELAKRYLREPSLPISEIAWLLGYADPSGFAHSFRRRTGMSPKRMRTV